MTARTDTSARRPIDSHTGLASFTLENAVRVDDLAVCYRATHGGTDRPLLVSILRRSDPLSLARFRLAAQLGHKVSHPGILPVIVAGRDTTYGDYMVTPDTGGRPLDELLANGALDVVVAVRIFSQVALVVDALHDQHIIHRDIQPAAILVSDDFSVQVTNLGFAACDASRDLVDFDDRDLASAYYPPALRLGHTDAQPSDDLFAMGVLLHHMVMGGVTPELPLPALAPSNPVNDAIDRIIKRLMSTTESVRYSSAAQAVQALRQVVPGAAVSVAGERQPVLPLPSSEQWDPMAEWLENPLEILMADALDADYLRRSQTRADALHRVDAIRRLLERWARQGWFRRIMFSQFMVPRHILSSNFYLYEMRVHYEKRTEPKVVQQIHRAGHIVPQVAVADVWDVDVAAPERFIDVPTVTMKVPGSQQVVQCEECSGSGKHICGTCSGRGTVDKKNKTQNADGSVEEVVQNAECRTCRGYGKVQCHACEGLGNILEEQTFQWSRYGKQFFNEDDDTGLHKPTLNTQSQLVYHKSVDIHDPQWMQVFALRELVEDTIREENTHVRAIAAELIIKATPVTEVDYELNKRQHTLSIMGFNNIVRGDWSLYDVERILLYATVAILVIAVVVMVFVLNQRSGWM
ncbi:MAG: protein kinase domain-containing protein [Roseiflexaceae bacterium]|nr:protein kinase [Chloroflexaceae bacterium]